MYTLIVISFLGVSNAGVFHSQLSCQWAAMQTARAYEQVSSTKVILQCSPVSIPDSVAATPGQAELLYPVQIIANPQ